MAMPSIVESVSSEASSPEARSALRELVSGDEEVTAEVAVADVASVASMLVCALADATTQEGGTDLVSDLVSVGGQEALDDIPSSLKEPSSFGDDLASALLPEKREQTARLLADKGDLTQAAYDSLLAVLGPVVVGVLARRKQSDGLDASGLAELIGEEAARLRSSDDAVGAGSSAVAAGALGAVVAAGRSQAAQPEAATADDASPGRTESDEAADAEDASLGRTESDEAADADDASPGRTESDEAAAEDTGSDDAGDDGTDTGTEGQSAVAEAAFLDGDAGDEAPRRRQIGVLVPLAAIAVLALGVAWLLSVIADDSGETVAVADGSGDSVLESEPAGPTAEDQEDAAQPEGPTDAGALSARSGADDADDADTEAAAENADDADADDADADDADADADDADAEVAGAEGSREGDASGVEGAEDAEPAASEDGGAANADDAGPDDEDTDAARAEAAEEPGGSEDAGVTADDTADKTADSTANETADKTADDPDGDGTGEDTTKDPSKGVESLNEILDLGPITFDYYDNGLSVAGRAELDKVVDHLGEHQTDVEIRGHTDAIGDAALNVRLGLRRAEAVKAYLVNAGVDADRLHAVGVGEVEPIARNDTEAGRAANRRIELLAR